MIVDLDTDELFYLLDNCMRGSHLRSGTIERFVDQWYAKMSEHQRMQLFEWSVRLSYVWCGGSDERWFEPSDSCCGKDIIFMKRFHPENQYLVTMKYRYSTPDGKWHRKTEKVRTFLMNGEYYISSTRHCDKVYITDIQKIDLPEWQKYKQPGVNYDKNILT